MKELRTLLRFISPHKHVFGVAVVSAILYGPLGVIPSLLAGVLLDSVLGDGLHWQFLSLSPTTSLLAIAITLGALALLTSGLLFAQRYAAGTLSENVIADLRLAVFQKLERQSADFFYRRTSGKLSLRFTGDMTAIESVITDGVVNGLRSAISLTAVPILLFLINWKLAIALVPPAMVYGILALKAAPALRRVGRAARKQRANIAGNVQERLAGMLTVQLNDAVDLERDKLWEGVTNLRDLKLRIRRLGGGLFSVGHLTTSFARLAVLCTGAFLIIHGQATPGTMVTFLLLAGFFFDPLQEMGRAVEAYQSGIVSLERVVEVLEDIPGVTESEGAAELSIQSGAVRLDQVSFRYRKGSRVLKDLSIDIPGGSRVVISGPAGAGKTTMARLIARHYDPRKGAVMIDGQDIRRATLASVRRAVAVVEAEPWLFSGTIADNIRYSRGNVSPDDMYAAAEAAGALEFIQRLPRNFETKIGERGLRLSTGQRQRIALARELLRRPAILILDEAEPSVLQRVPSIQQLYSPFDGPSTIIVLSQSETLRHPYDILLRLSDGQVIPSEFVSTMGSTAEALSSPGGS